MGREGRGGEEMGGDGGEGACEGDGEGGGEVL